MIDSKYLLNDEQIAQFITHGFITLKTDFSDEFHNTVLSKMAEVYAKEGNPGNNLIPRVPEVQKFFDHPTVRGGLTSLLGPDYVMHTHRHGHFNRPGTSDGGWHKDNYWGNEKTRNHVPWSAMIFYYPQDVTPDMGPTGIMPGSQNRYKINKDEEINFPVVGEKGTLALISYDLWHRATANSSLNDRYMLKFIFFRMKAPTHPEWNNQRKHWQTPQDMMPVKDNSILWEDVWNWMSGTPSWQKRQLDPASAPKSPTDDVAALTEALYGENENDALNAAYSLAALGEKGVPALAEALQFKDEDVVHPLKYSLPRLAAHGLAAAGPVAIPALIDALDAEYENPDVRGQVAYALGEMREHAAPAVPKLVKLLEEGSPFVRQHVVEALGQIRQPTELTVPALSKSLQDEDVYTRFLSGLALARIGPDAAAAVPALAQALHDETLSKSLMLGKSKDDRGARYVSAIASTALQRIRTDEALDVLLPFLQTAKWCPVTTKVSTF
jgi:HEAT repeat protein